MKQVLLILNVALLLVSLPVAVWAMDSQGDPDTNQPTSEPVAANPEGKDSASQDDIKALAKKAQNPVANMRSVQFQNNTNLGTGPDNATQNMLNIIPVVPIKLSKDLLLITRTIVPITSQPDFLTPEGEGRINGLGDTTFSSFISPMAAQSTTWGVGPIFLVPTATDDALGADKWGAGITAITLATPGNWVYGGIASNVWSVGGPGEQDINLFSFQYFINLNFDHGWYAMTSPIITANWEADSDHRWTLPVGGGMGKIVKLGKQPVNFQLSAYKNVMTPDDYGSSWQVRTLVMLMFPK